MHPQFRIDMIHQRTRELATQADRARLLTAEPTRSTSANEAVLRLCKAPDESSLARLAILEEQKLSPGRHLVAEVNGEIVAALPLAGGPFLGDPFRPTAHLQPLMRRRAAELKTPRSHRLTVLDLGFAHARTTIR